MIIAIIIGWLLFAFADMFIVYNNDDELHLQCFVVSLLLGPILFLWITIVCGQEVVLVRKNK